MSEESASEPEPDDPDPLDQSNTERLRIHFASGSLAAEFRLGGAGR